MKQQGVNQSSSNTSSCSCSSSTTFTDFTAPSSFENVGGYVCDFDQTSLHDIFHYLSEVPLHVTAPTVTMPPPKPAYYHSDAPTTNLNVEKPIHALHQSYQTQVCTTYFL